MCSLPTTRTSGVPEWDATWCEFRRRRQRLGHFVLTLPLIFLYGIGLIVFDPRGAIGIVLIVPLALIMPLWFIAYVVLLSRVLFWRCPKCRRHFCYAWWIAWPFANRCLHCGQLALD